MPNLQANLAFGFIRSKIAACLHRRPPTTLGINQFQPHQDTHKPMKLREKQMLERQNRILDTAERLIRETGSTDFSVRRLAAESEVSPATPFNLFGSKEGILYSLLLKNLDGFFEKGFSFKKKNKLFHVLEASETAADIFIEDAVFLRPLYKVLLGVTHEEHRPAFMKRTFSYWKMAAEAVPGNDCLAGDNINITAYALMAHFTGLMEMWINFDMSDEEFKAHVICGTVITVLSFIKPEDKDTLLAVYEKNKKKISAEP
jgi:AcrR family transcriptional regulator